MPTLMPTLTVEGPSRVENAEPASDSELWLQDICRAAGVDAAVISTTMPGGHLQVCQRFNLAEQAERRYVAAASTDRISWQALLHGSAVGKDQFQEPLIIGDGLAVVAAVRVDSPVFAGFPGVVTFFNHHSNGPLALAPAVPDQLQDQVVHGSDTPRQFFFDADARCLNHPDWANHFAGPAAAEIAAEVRKRLAAEPILDASTARFATHDAQGRIVALQIVGPVAIAGLDERPVLAVSLHPRVEDWKALRPDDFAGDSELCRLVSSVRHMVEHYREGPTLQTIADAAHLSQFHFHRRFSERIGITPKALLYDLQLNEAKRLLAEGRMPLAEIARHCGFAHQSHFTSRFKQGTGITPTQWRRTAAAVH